MPATELALLVAMAAFIVATYVGAGWLVLRRVREHWQQSHRVLSILVLLGWPAVVLGVEVGWLLGINEWHLRPDR